MNAKGLTTIFYLFSFFLNFKFLKFCQFLIITNVPIKCTYEPSLFSFNFKFGMARANMNKSVWLVTNTTTASKYIHTKEDQNQHQLKSSLSDLTFFFFMK